MRRIAGWLNGRRGVILSLAALWALVTAVGAGRPAQADAWLGLPGFDWLVYVFVTCLVIGAVAIVAAIILAPKGSGAPPAPRRPIWPLLLVILIVLLLSQRRSDSPEDGVEAAPPPPPADVPVEDGFGGSGALGQGEVGVLVLFLAAAVVVLVLSRRRGDELVLDDEVETLEEALAPAVSRATEQLDLGTDPRAAVLRAYAGLEDVLTGRNQPRAPNETPTEHLRRALATLSVDTEPLLELARLYQVARFSDHPITVDQQEQAAESLRRVRSQLAATS